jgi:hypothetical protein
MSLRDTFETYNPVTLAVGCFFVAAGCWIIFEFAMHASRTLVGAAVILVFASMPISIGAAIVHSQFRLRRSSNKSSTRRMSS